MRRGALKRDEITKKVLKGGKPKEFAAILHKANGTLKTVFGVQLVEMKTRAEREARNNAAADPKTEGGDGAQKKKGACFFPFLLASGS